MIEIPIQKIKISGSQKLSLFLQKYIENKEYPGIFLLKRTGQKDEEITKSLADILFAFVQYQRKERVENKIQAKNLSVLFGWKQLIKNYFKAHCLALKN